jgi:hypothetical protein
MLKKTPVFTDQTLRNTGSIKMPETLNTSIVRLFQMKIIGISNISRSATTLIGPEACISREISKSNK